MQRIWNYISNLGTTGKRKHLSSRTIIMTNQLNLVLFVTALILFIVTARALWRMNEDMSYGTLRIVVLSGITFINLVMARFGFTRLSRLSVIFLPPLAIILWPTLIGYVEEESYVYYPYVLICASIVPQILVHQRKEKFLFWFSVAYYFVLTFFIDNIMSYFSSTSFPIVDRINTFYPFYKIAPLMLFLFTNASIYYLRLLNIRFEEELSLKNSELDIQNRKLKVQKEKIEQQKDELVSKEISTWQKLVKIVSHEIVNSAIPITNLAGMTGQMLEDESGEVLKPEKIDPETAEDIHHSLKIIKSRTQGLINFVNATKSLTQIPKPNIRRVTIKELFDRITVLYQAKFREAGIELGKNIVPPDLHIEADLELIEQVMINLFQNALEAMGGFPHPKLSVNALKNDSGQVEITVTDNGPGIGEENMERIFIPFYSTKTNKSGIGLSLSQQIVMLHNGRLEVSSKPEMGTTFRIII